METPPQQLTQTETFKKFRPVEEALNGLEPSFLLDFQSTSCPRQKTRKSIICTNVPPSPPLPLKKLQTKVKVLDAGQGICLKKTKDDPHPRSGAAIMAEPASKGGG